MPSPVLLLARELDLGGSERQLALLARALDRSQFTPIVGCFRPAGLRGRELAAVRVPIQQFPVYSFASPSAAIGALQLARFIRSRGIRLVHAFDYPLAVFAVPVTRFLTAAVALSSQRSHRDLIPSHYRPLVRLTDRLAHAVVVNCESVRRHLERDERVPPDRIRLCYNGVDLDEFRPGVSPRPSALPKNSLVIGVTCALRLEKALPDLLHAFARLQPTRRELKLAIIGSGSGLGALQSLAQSLKIANDCIFEPAASDVVPWLRAIDIFVLPSHSEALSNSLMEAMACGCCAIASNVGGNPELIEDGVTGLLFQPGDETALVNALERLIENPALRQRLAESAVERIHANFSLQASAARMAEIYVELIDRRARARP
jgi:L-malate glycosyltransferase